MQEISGQRLFEELGYDHLKSGALFGALSMEAVRFLMAEGILLQVDAGEVIYCPGEAGDKFYIVCEGSIDFYKHFEGDMMKTRTVSFGDQVGFVSMIALYKHEGKVVAAERSKILKVSSSVFSKFHDRYPFDFGVLLMNLTRDIARTLRKVSNTLVHEHCSHN